MGKNLVVAAVVVSLSAGTIAAAKECSAVSGERSAALMELYTSEGCNSCPPADAWVNDLPNNGFSTERIVPLAFHVDYWDYIGWKDRFAKPLFTERQRLASQRNGLGTIYTPQLLLNGVAYRKWGDAQRLALALDLIDESKPRADLGLTLASGGADELRLRATAQVNDANAKGASQLFLAVYENNLKSDVRAGENRGVTLRHNYVVREWIGPLPIEASGRAEVVRSVALAREWKRQDLGVAAFVEHRDSGAILQALALPACL